MRFLVATLFVAFVAVQPAAARAQDGASALWDALRGGGHVVLMRHALAPGTGDPADFRLDDCSTQRNLSQQGRDQARAIGNAFRSNGVDVGRVLSSQWCRCLETARLLDLGEVEEEPMLNSFFGNRARGPAQTEALEAFLSRPVDGPTLVLVTHQVNITGATDVFPRSGEMVVIRPDGERSFTVLGSLEIDSG